MRIMNEDGTYSYSKNGYLDKRTTMDHIIGELGYLASFPVDNVFRVKHNCIKNIQRTSEIDYPDKQFLIKLIKRDYYEKAQLGVLEIIDNE